MLNVSSILGLFILFLNMNVFASDCTQQSFDESFICEKTFRAKSLSDIERYKTEEALGKKNLLIAFDLVNDQSLEIHTPCMVRFHKDFHINTTGDLCIDARDGIRLHYSKTISANDITLYSKNRIAIQREATIKVNNLTMISNGDTLESRVHIRHSSTVNANNLFLSGYEMATLGHSSQYQVANTLTLNSDKFAYFRNNSTYTAQNFVSEARDCKVTGVETTSTAGCFNPSRPTARFRAVEREINTGDSLSFMMDRSLAPNGLSEYVFLVNGVEYQRGTDFNFDFDFNEPGTFYVKGEVIDSLGLVSSVQRKITVTDIVEKDFNAQFVYNIDGDELNLFFMQNMPLDQYQNGVLTVNGEATNLENFYHRSLLKTISGAGIYNVSLAVTDIYGQSYSFDKIIEVGDEEFNANVNPIVDINLYNTGYKNVFVDVTGAFDPSGEYQSIIIDWGDDTSEEFEFQEVIGVKHEYATSGVYEVSVSVVKEGSDDQQIVETEIREIQVTNDEVSQIAPVADYLTYQEDFASHVIFNVHLAASPTSEISSVVLDYGDGSSSQVLEKAVDTHFYEPGIYFPKLIVTDVNGLQTIKESRVTIVESGPPTVSEVLCESDGLDIECDLIAIDKLRQLESLEINWGDGSSDTIQIEDSISEEFYWEGIEHQYSEEGTYTLTFYVNTLREETATKDFEYTIGSSSGGGGTVEEDYINADINCYSDLPAQVTCDASSSYFNNGYISNYEFIINGVESHNSSEPYQVFDTSIYEGQNIQIDLIVTASNGSQQSATTYVYVQQKTAPIVSFNCVSNSIRTLDCNHSSTDDYGISSVLWSLSTGEQFTDHSFSYQANSNDDVEVTLTVTNVYGMTSTLTNSFAIQQDMPPVASFQCSSDEPRQLVCVNNSYDDIGAVSSHWVLNDGTEFNSNNLDIILSSDNDVQVTLEVMDSTGKTSTASQLISIYKDPITEPYVSFSCDLKESYFLNCIGEAYSRVEGEIISYNWFVDGVLKASGNGSIFEYNQLKIGHNDITLEVKDSKGYTAQFSSTVEINTIPGVAHILCKQVDNYILNCNANDSYFLSKADFNVEWYIDGERFSEGTKDVSFSFDSSGSYNIGVKVIDSMSGSFAETFIQYSVEELSQSDIPSKASLTIAGETNRFFNVQESIMFSISDALEVNELNVLINDDRVSPENLVYDNNSIEVSGSLVDGLNTITIYFRDENQQIASAEFELYAGSRSVSYTGNANQLDFYYVGVSDGITINVSNSLVLNVPNLDYIVSDSSSLGAKTMYLGKTNSSIFFRSEIVSSSFFGNNQYKVDLFEGDFTSSLIEEGKYDYVSSNTSMMSLQHSSEGIVHLRFSEVDDNFVLPLDYFSSVDDSFVFILISKGDNKKILNIRGTAYEDLNDKLLDVVSSKSLGGAGDVNVELLSYTPYNPDTSLVTKFFNYLISKTVADESSPTVLNLVDINGLDIVISDLKLTDDWKYEQGYELNNFPTGPFSLDFVNTSYAPKNELGESVLKYKIKFNLESSNGTDEVYLSSYRFYVYICPYGSIGMSSLCRNYMLSNVVKQNNSEGSYFDGTLLLPSSTILDSNFLRLKLVVKDDLYNSPITAGNIKTKSNNLLFRNIINMHALIGNNSKRRYGYIDPMLDVVDGYNSAGEYSISESDIIDGGDSWVSYSHKESVKNLFSVKYSFWDMSLPDSVAQKEDLNVLFNDISSSGGDNDGVTGLRHKSHKNGIQLDMRYLPNKKMYSSSFYQGSQEGASLPLDAMAIEHVINTDSTIVRRVLAEQYTGEFEKYVKTSCIDDGRRLDELILKNYPPHKDHFHLNLFDFKPNNYKNIGRIESVDKSLYVLPNIMSLGELIRTQESDSMYRNAYKIPESLVSSAHEVSFYVWNSFESFETLKRLKAPEKIGSIKNGVFSNENKTMLKLNDVNGELYLELNIENFINYLRTKNNFTFYDVNKFFHIRIVEGNKRCIHKDFILGGVDKLMDRPLVLSSGGISQSHNLDTITDEEGAVIKVIQTKLKDNRIFKFYDTDTEVDFGVFQLSNDSTPVSFSSIDDPVLAEIPELIKMTPYVTMDNNRYIQEYYSINMKYELRYSNYFSSRFNYRYVSSEYYPFEVQVCEGETCCPVDTVLINGRCRELPPEGMAYNSNGDLYYIGAPSCPVICTTHYNDIGGATYCRISYDFDLMENVESTDTMYSRSFFDKDSVEISLRCRNNDADGSLRETTSTCTCTR